VEEVEGGRRQEAEEAGGVLLPKGVAGAEVPHLQMPLEGQEEEEAPPGLLAVQEEAAALLRPQGAQGVAQEVLSVQQAAAEGLMLQLIGSSL
jgi:hypothetical protein